MTSEVMQPGHDRVNRRSDAPGTGIYSRMLRALAALTLALALPAAAAQAQTQAPVDDTSLPLVYVFVVDGLDGDRVDMGQAPFLSRMLLGQEQNRATYYQESRSIMVAETNPNHVAMATGAFGDRSGIPGNAFAVQDAASKAACGANPEDTGAVDVDGETGTCMIAESFFAATTRLADLAVTSAAILGKPKLAQIFATKRVGPNAYDADHLWSPCDPSEPADYCDPNAPARPNDGYAVTDTEVMDHVLQTVNDGVDADGTKKRPNLSFVNMPTVDSAGHGTGTGPAYAQAVALADQQLQRFVTNQKELGLWERTIMFVVSDHSMDTTLDKATSLRLAFNAGGISDSDFLVVQNGSVDMVYLKDRNRPDRDEVLKQMREIAAGSAGVDEALYRVPNPADGGPEHALDVVHPGWRIAGERTGDLFVTHVEGGAFNEPNPLTGNHGGPQTSDNTFVVFSGGPQVRQQSIAGTVGPRFDDTLQNPGQAQNVDVAPTVMALFGLAPPFDSEGRVLTEAFEPGALPARGSLIRHDGSTAGSGGGTGTTCTPLDQSPFVAAGARPRGRGVRFLVQPNGAGSVDVDVFQQSVGRRLLDGRLVARFRDRTNSFTWNGRGTRRRARKGFLVVRMRAGGETRRFALRRVRGRFRARRAFEQRPRCGLIERAALSRPVITRRRGLTIAFRTRRDAQARVQIVQRGRIVNSSPFRERTGGATYRVRLSGTGVRPGDFEVRIVARGGGEQKSARLFGRRL